MTSVVQTNYRPSIAAAVVGLVADETGYDTLTRQCGTVAGIPFGRAVSRSTGKSVVLGGGSFIGISCRDITQVLVPIDPLSTTDDTLDTIGFYKDVPVLTRGHIWVPADNMVAPGDAVYYDFPTGRLGNSANGISPSGSIYFTAQPAVGNTVTVGGVAFTAVAVGAAPGATEFALGMTLSDTITNLAAQLNASSNSTVDNCTYAAYPPGGADTLLVSSDTPGSTDDAFGLATNVTGATCSDTTLTNGYAGVAPTADLIFSLQPADNATVTLNGTVVTLHDGTGGTVNRGASLAACVDNLVTFLNLSGDAEIAKCTYTATGAPHDTLHIVSDTVGPTNNAFTVAASASPDAHGLINAAVSGTLGGGIVASTLISGAKWLTAAIVNGLAILSLGVQQ